MAAVAEPDEPSPASRSFGRRVMAAGIVWLVVATCGLAALWHYAATPGEARVLSDRWPAETSIERDAAGPTLVMFVHPRCPCSRASMGELARIVATCQGRLTTRIAFLAPKGFDDDWTHTDLWRAASEIPGATVLVDREGVESRRFGASTSGAVRLYDAAGRLAFAGGITSARGHAGDSEGSDAIESLVLGRPADATEAPVFGCSLDDPETCGGGAK